MRVVRILGVDPGSRLTGYGVVDLIGNQIRLVAHGTLRLSNTGGKAVIPLEQRLLLIHQGLSQIILDYKPSIMSIERVFFAKNAVSALKLGQARGAAILCGAIHALEIAEYSPSEVKSSVAGYGNADKQQVARMLQIIFGLKGEKEFVTSDASDGLALAICHAHRITSSARGATASATAGSGAGPNASNALRAALQQNGARKKKRLSMAESIGLRAPEKTPEKKK
jgi:crossover junction endodeoxyribonuclease RuvC